MTPRAPARCLWFCLVASALGGASSTLGDEPKGVRWVGPEVLLYAESTRPEMAFDRAMSDRVGHLLDGVPAYKAALAKPEVLAGRGVAAIVAAGLGTTWQKGLRDLTGGGIVAAVEGTKGPERIFVVVTPKDASLLERTHARLLEFARNDANTKKKPDPITEGDHRGIKTYSLAPTEAHAILDGALVVANGPETLNAIIDRSMDGGPALADDPTFAAQRKAADPEALAWGFARTDRLRKIDPKRFGAEAKPDGGALFVFGPWIEAALKGEWAAASLVWTEERVGVELVVAVPEGGYSDAMKRYLPTQGHGAPRPLLPDSVIASGSLWRDLASIWEVRADIFPPETVQGLAQLDTTAGTFFGGRDFGTGVLGAIGDRWNVVVADQDFDAMDPKPDTKFPAFALIVELKPDDPEFATRLMAGFQSFLGLINLGAAQTKSPPLMIVSDSFEGYSIATSRYQPVYKPTEGDAVPSLYNFAPSAVQVGDSFVVSSNLGLARDLTKTLREAPEPSGATLLMQASGSRVASLLERNKDQLVVQNMLSKGNAKQQAESEINVLLDLLRYAGKATLSATDRADSAVLKLNFQLDAK